MLWIAEATGAAAAIGFGLLVLGPSFLGYTAVGLGDWLALVLFVSLLRYKRAA